MPWRKARKTASAMAATSKIGGVKTWLRNKSYRRHLAAAKISDSGVGGLWRGWRKQLKAENAAKAIAESKAA